MPWVKKGTCEKILDFTPAGPNHTIYEWLTFAEYNTRLATLKELPDLNKLATTEIQEKTDSVNHPSHYTSHPSGIEAITITQHYNFCLGNTIKYIWRAGLKKGSSELEDLKKARWYLDHEISRREAELLKGKENKE